MTDSRCGAHLQSSAREPALSGRHFHLDVASMKIYDVITFPLKHYLFIHSHLHPFEMQGWQELGQETETYSIVQCSSLEPGLSAFQWIIAPLSKGWNNSSLLECHGINTELFMAKMPGQNFHLEDFYLYDLCLSNTRKSIVNVLSSFAYSDEQVALI